MPLAMSSLDFDDPRFSRTFQLPADVDRGRPAPLTVAYADFGYRNEAAPETEHVLLFFGPMLASRLIHVFKDDLAKRHHVRFICIDRPGLGSSDPVDVRLRIRIVTDAMVALLAHLRIAHVSLACHSGGTVFALDFLLHHPQILDPQRPFLAVGAPWVLPKHSGVALMSLTQSLPASLLGRTDKFATFAIRQVAPLLGVTIGFSQAVVTKLAGQKGDAAAEQLEPDVAAEEQNWQQLLDRIYGESIAGLSDEAKMLMLKGDGLSSTGWSDWGDYDVLVPRLSAVLAAASRKLKVSVFFAESDMMIGDKGSKGPRWFDQCWSAESRGDSIEYKSTVVEDSNHDRIWNLKLAVMKEVVGVIGQPLSEGQPPGCQPPGQA